MAVRVERQRDVDRGESGTDEYDRVVRLDPIGDATGPRVVDDAARRPESAGGRIAEVWVVYDALGMFQKIGVLPALG